MSPFDTDADEERQQQGTVPTAVAEEVPLLNNTVIHDNPSLFQEHLRQLSFFLSVLGFDQKSFWGIVAVWSAFLVGGVGIPFACLLFVASWFEDPVMQALKFELFIVAFEVVLAGISLLCVAHGLRKYGVTGFLFVDRFENKVAKFRKQYILKIKGFFSILKWWIIAMFAVKVLSKVVWVAYKHQGPLWISVIILMGLLMSWLYRTAVYLSACMLFNIVCSFHIIHFEDFGKLLEANLRVSIYLDEHRILHRELTKISHRFRIFLLLVLLFVTTSQFVTLIEATGYSQSISGINICDFVVSSVVQVFGLILCLHAGARITHRAQGLASVASHWHAWATCYASGALEQATSETAEQIDANQDLMYMSADVDSDAESLNTIMGTHTLLASYVSSYQQREALVLYLQSNPGGLTLFGWSIDRSLIVTLVFLEMSLVLFVLGKTISLASNSSLGTLTAVF